MFQKLTRLLVGDPHKREIQKLLPLVEQINQLEKTYEGLSDDALRARTAEFRRQLQDGKTLDDLLPEAFAAVREASKRTIGLRHYDVQLIGGMALHQCKIAEMRTGEGKTLVATLPLYLNALAGRGAHLVTVNDYLARRDARWMAPIYNALGMSVGVLQMASRTENGRKAFLVDLEKKSSIEDQNQLVLVPRAEAYRADITYGTNSEFGFDYLRDNLTMRLEERSQRGHYYAIVDEVDNILIDEARTPLIISGPAGEDLEWYPRMAQIVRQLQEEDYEISERDHSVSLTETGLGRVEELLEMSLGDPDQPEELTPEQARVMGYLEQALRAQFLFKRNKDYLVQTGKVVIVDEFTGRLMPGRRWSDGLHQAVEAKEGVRVEPENVTYATITLQNYFRMYEKLSGMTGTALTEAEEFYKIYKLDVLPITTNLEYRAMGEKASLVEVKSQDVQGYAVSYYALQGDAERKPVYWRRQDFPDVVYQSEEAKLRAITREIVALHVKGRPLLVGTTSVEHSERLADRLQAEPLRRLMQTLLLRQAWLRKNNRNDDERAIPELQFLNKPITDLDVAEMRPLARTLELSMNPEDDANLPVLLEMLALGQEDASRLVRVLQGGVPIRVLNARKHDEESQIIAGAGAFGAVTIATNMAGRGVDIKLGGELPETVLADTSRVLERCGQDPYSMNYEQRYEALRQIAPEEYSIYEEAVNAFITYMENMHKVRQLGGLHVVGSERHEARRIDNQLRGRAARQGDPGSSRFYLSLQDELMRMFGGAQVEGLLKRVNIDESLPIESGMVGRLVEQSQGRVEGANFDVRKHLLEYDDVLNSQRKRIYSQRDRVFTKQDLSEDVLEMLHAELVGRIPKALQDEEGPWKLMAYLDQVQPPILGVDTYYPSFTYRLLFDEIRRSIPPTDNHTSGLRAALLSVAGRALKAEQTHILRATREALDRFGETLDEQRQERLEALDNFLDGIKDQVEESGPRRPSELVEELAGLVRIPQLRLSPDMQRQLVEATPAVRNTLRQAVSDYLLVVATHRMIGWLERRLDEEMGVRASQFQGMSWGEISTQLLHRLEAMLDQRMEKLVGSGGQILRDLDPVLDRLEDPLDEDEWIRLLEITRYGTRLAFDRRSHRQVQQRVVRMNYTYLVAQLLEGMSDQAITGQVLTHLEGAVEALQLVIGQSECSRQLQPGDSIDHLDDFLKGYLRQELEPQSFNALVERPFDQLGDEDQETIFSLVGKRILNEIYRHILLSVISDSWVDYLTQVEALRVSIGLEAYAQRDPLVQYKGRASEMFQELLSEIRAGVIGRMYTYRPRLAVPADATTAAAQPAQETIVEVKPAGEEKKRKRHRR